MLLLSIQLLLIPVTLSECLNILAIMPHEGKSHQLVFEPLFEKLALNGHNLTLITQFPQKNPIPNWRDVNISAKVRNSTEILGFSSLTGTHWDKYVGPVLLASFAYKSCQEGLSHPNFQNFLKEENHFDVLLVEIFNTPCFMGLTKRYNAPAIGISSSTWMPWTYQWVGSPSNPSYVPNQFLGHSNEMDFFSRVENTIMHVYTNVVFTVLMDFFGNRLSKQYTNIDLKENGDVMRNMSALLVNSHYSLNLPLPLSPNTIEIGGIYVFSKPPKPLPQDLETFIKESEHGVIYMSMGSTIKGDTFPEAKKQAFLEAFSKLPQRVIWKWEGEMKNKPDKVMTYRWAPQRDILCHPNVKVFISHAGLLGTMESVDCGKPILMLPLLGDQFVNAKAVEKSGGGVVLNLYKINEEIILGTLQKLLSQEYIQKAEELSERFKDRPMSPMDTALYWIDYVARHKGAHFMKVASVDMPFYQLYLIDVVIFISVVIGGFTFICYMILRFILKRVLRKQKMKRS